MTIENHFVKLNSVMFVRYTKILGKNNKNGCSFWSYSTKFNPYFGGLYHDRM